MLGTLEVEKSDAINGHSKHSAVSFFLFLVLQLYLEEISRESNYYCCNSEPLILF